MDWSFHSQKLVSNTRRRFCQQETISISLFAYELRLVSARLRRVGQVAQRWHGARRGRLVSGACACHRCVALFIAYWKTTDSFTYPLLRLVSLPFLLIIFVYYSMQIEKAIIVRVRKCVDCLIFSLSTVY